MGVLFFCLFAFRSSALPLSPDCFGFSKFKTIGGPTMGYNKARAEKQWLAWKNQEESQLRALGVDEDTIQRLHSYDWQSFKRERAYQERHSKLPFDEEVGSMEIDLPVHDPQSLIDSMDNPALVQVLQATDKVTLWILLLKMDGYKSREIADRFGLTVRAVDQRILRFKQKVKKIL